MDEHCKKLTEDIAKLDKGSSSFTSATATSRRIDLIAQQVDQLEKEVRKMNAVNGSEKVTESDVNTEFVRNIVDDNLQGLIVQVAEAKNDIAKRKRGNNDDGGNKDKEGDECVLVSQHCHHVDQLPKRMSKVEKLMQSSGPWFSPQPRCSCL